MKRLVLVCISVLISTPLLSAEPLRVGVFNVDASPPIGSPLAYDPTKEIESPLSARGVVILGSGKPIVLCAVDWIGIGNGSHREFCTKLAAAAGTEANRVSVHTLHQHDAPWSDFSSDDLAKEKDVPYRPFDSKFGREVIERVSAAIEKAIHGAQPISHVGTSMAIVEKVASNRRILGEDGRVKHVRFTATKDPTIRDFPEGTIDPQLRMISFWNGEKAVAVLTYYATHPQSYYRTGKANPDFPGMARNARESATKIPHIHFDGAGGNVGAGKYNDGAVENRQVLADRMADAMKRAWDTTDKKEITSDDVAWNSVAVALPPAPHLNERTLLATIDDREKAPLARFQAVTALAWLRRCEAKEKIDIGCLSLGKTRVLHLPGELFVEYQLEAQRLAPENFVAMAAYGDYGCAYIGTQLSYSQGGYEVGPTASYVAPEAEAVLMTAIAKLLGANESALRPLR